MLPLAAVSSAHCASSPLRNQLRNGQVDSAESRHRTSEQQHGLAYVEKTPTGIDMPQFNSKSPKKKRKNWMSGRAAGVSGADWAS